MSMYDDVGDFHEKFGLPRTRYTHREVGNTRTGSAPVMVKRVYLQPPKMLTDDEFQYRLRFMQEELFEFIRAHREGNMIDAADALADLAWVVLGTAHFMNLPFDEVWAEVRRANLDKTLAVEEDVEHKRGKVERIRKPAGWRPPQLHKVLMITTEDQEV